MQKKFFLLSKNKGSDCFKTEKVESLPLAMRLSII